MRMFSRVGFLGTGVVAAATVAGLYAQRATASVSVQVWGLDPAWGGDPQACGCGGCTACHSHATNKLFASVSDAGANRAHVFCKCLVVPLALVDESIYNALFLEGGPRASVDRRSPWVRDLLAQGPPVPVPPLPVSPAPVPTERADGSPAENSAPGGTSTPPDLTENLRGVSTETLGRYPRGSDRHVQATLARVRWRSKHHGKRALYIDVNAVEAVTVTLALVRGSETLARRTVTAVHGEQTLKVMIPSKLKGRSAHLHVMFQDAAGNTKRSTRAIAIPPRAPAVSRR